MALLATVIMVNGQALRFAGRKSADKAMPLLPLIQVPIELAVNAEVGLGFLGVSGQTHPLLL